MPSRPTPRTDLPHRPRRNRRTAAIRGLCRETILAPDQLIYPVFIHDKDVDEPIDAMPGCSRWSPDGLLRDVERALEAGVRSLVLFPKIEDELKTPDAEEATRDEGLVPRTIRNLRRRFPELAIITDIALDPYNSLGHDGLVIGGEIVNDATVEVLCRQALSHARAGADIVAPSDMMDGRVAAIRGALDNEGFTNVSIMSYTAKYASALYGPFRGALDSAPKTGEDIPKDKKTYQMDVRNAREALRELRLDEAEGADIVMVKPAVVNLDIIRRIREATALPVAAYHVSGEYLMIKAAAASGWLDEAQAALETLTAIRRAGADMILTYFAPQVAGWLKELGE